MIFTLNKLKKQNPQISSIPGEMLLSGVFGSYNFLYKYLSGASKGECGGGARGLKHPTEAADQMIWKIGKKFNYEIKYCFSCMKYKTHTV